MASAAAAFGGTLEVKEVVDVDGSVHAEYRVVRPNTETLDVGTDDVGTLITVTDDEGKSYSAGVGAKVMRGTQAGIDPRPLVYYCQRPGDTVFTIDLNAGNLQHRVLPVDRCNLLRPAV